jgi:hydroxymethylglutaryl-CoA lyase
MPDVMLCEMSPRDGLQYLGRGGGGPPRLIPPAMKQALIEALAAAGLPYIEVGSFVSRTAIPQLADTDELCTLLRPTPGVRLAALVPNLKHYERFRASGLDTVALFISASAEYSQKNMGAPIDTALGWALDVAQAARADGKPLRAHVSAAFQELSRGGAAESDLATVLRLTRRLLDAGCACVALADTNGQTSPRRVVEVLSAVRSDVGLERVGVHLHERGGVAMASAWAAFEAGVRVFDASVGGLGGSVIAAALGSDRASGGGSVRTPGNIATEELVELFERCGVSTGIDRDALLRAGRIACEITRATGDAAPPGRLLRETLRVGDALT